MAYVHANVEYLDVIPPNLVDFDPRSIIHVRSREGLENTRKRLIRYVWKQDTLPTEIMPRVANENEEFGSYDDIGSLKQIRRLEVDMELGVNSVIYELIPNNPSEKYIIYSQGHHGDFIRGKKTIEAFLDHGYVVFGMSMPLLGMNSTPIYESEWFGPLPLKAYQGHNVFDLLETDEFSPIKYFLEPVTAIVNYVRDRYQAECVALTGVSGGGWTTTVYAAIDDRVCYSFPVAGSLPLYLRLFPPNTKTLSDYENSHVGDMYRIANYLDMYVMGSSGPGRKQIQILNKYDAEVFRGIVARTYEPAVQEAVAEIGPGSFRLVIDDTHAEHKVSDVAIKEILSAMD